MIPDRRSCPQCNDSGLGMATSFVLFVDFV